MSSLPDTSFYRVFSEVREKSETAEHNPFFGNKTDAPDLKIGAWSAALGFPRTFGIACRKYAANPETLEHTTLFEQRSRR